MIIFLHEESSKGLPRHKSGKTSCDNNMTRFVYHPSSTVYVVPVISGIVFVL